MPRDLIRISLFGSFHPDHSNAASSTTGIAYLLDSCASVCRLDVYGPDNSTLPKSIRSGKTRLTEAWKLDDPISLIRTAISMSLNRGSTDAYLFNIYLTSFGRRRISNGIGLLVPVCVRFLSLRPVVVYLHSLLETQDVTALGYSPGRLERFAVRLLEMMIARTTKLAMPIRGNVTAVRRELGLLPAVLTLPFVDAVYLSRDAAPLQKGKVEEAEVASHGLNVLLFGAWGPQKDLLGVVNSLQRLGPQGLVTKIRIAGHINPKFPEYAQVIRKIAEGAKAGNSVPGIEIIDNPSDEQIPAIFEWADVLILPYVALAGFSGVLNLGGFFGCEILAYDVQGLRECAETLGLEVTFVPASDEHRLIEGLETVRGRVSERIRRPTEVQRALQLARKGGSELVELVLTCL